MVKPTKPCWAKRFPRPVIVDTFAPIFLVQLASATPPKPKIGFARKSLKAIIKEANL